ncbi:4-(cytidine 5'-diphospho)-2-C-methyl-D-erythritol kinase [Lentisphaerota bacterium ZTH]|nr:4-(cytidine 5'-diphospho)-2-C-methyl-D-erythritol kinase [Lentisphaerota bacterium]WET06662.1 4-(cytidine 5'-diphospho)-2-C-methyl-D-erythritol kinase [Lentisphaerota bacterium ZTH]
MEAVTYTAPAKINLYLKVTGKRSDGYHNLDTLFLPLSFPADRVTLDFAAKEGIEIACNTYGVPLDSKNICWKAADSYYKQAGIAPACKITIEKNIPVAAGLGGGSSNAASVLKALNSHFDALGSEALTRIAMSCGADVPFFLDSKPAFAAGTGDAFEYPDNFVFNWSLLLINPGFPVSAAWAYSHLSKDFIGALSSGFRNKLLAGLQSGSSETLKDYIHNDLAAALYYKFPLLKMLRRDLLAAGADAVEISGSGPTLFALCRDDAVREQLIGMLEEYHQPLQVFKAEVL